MTLPRRKTLVYFALCLALFAVAVIWVDAPEAHAKVNLESVKNLATKALGGGADIGIGLAIVYIVLLVIYEFAFYIVAFAGLFLDILYAANIIIVPSTSPIVLVGWTALRDIANGLFILLVLWVAITIIFNLETLGGKRLLVRIIVVALLINFSLLMTTTVFAFANQLALPFSRALGMDPYNPKVETTLSSLIIQETKLHELGRVIRDEGATEQFKKSTKAAAASGKSEVAGPASLWIAGIPQSLGVSPVVPPAQAGLGEGAVVGTTCLSALGLPSILTGGTLLSVCGVLAIAATAFLNATDVAGVVASAAGWILTPYINLAVADMFLILTAAALASAAILLAVRYMAIMFLGVFAPIAFLGLLVPRYGEKIWNMWLENLFRWAFVAPIFYFLMYLSVYMLQAVSSAQSSFTGSDKIQFQGNALYIFSLIIFLVFLWASIFLTRKAAGMGAEAALSFGKKLAGVGLGVGTGLAARWALPAAGRFATKAGEWINQRPYARTILGRGLPGYGLRTVARASRQQVLDAEARISRMGLTSAETQQMLASGRFHNAADVAGAVRVLQKNRDLTPQSGVEGYGDTHLRQAADTMRGLNLDFVPFLRANPTIATRADFGADDFSAALNGVLAENGRTGQTPTAAEEQEAAQRLAWQLVRPGDIETTDLGIFSEKVDPQNTAKRMFWRIAGGDHLSRLGRLNTRTADTLQIYLDSPQGQAVWNSFDSERKRKLTEYFASNAAKEFSWHLPTYAAEGSAGGTGGGGQGTPPPGGSTPPPGGGPAP